MRASFDTGDIAAIAGACRVLACAEAALVGVLNAVFAQISRRYAACASEVTFTRQRHLAICMPA